MFSSLYTVVITVSIRQSKEKMDKNYSQCKLLRRHVNKELLSITVDYKVDVIQQAHRNTIDLMRSLKIALY